MYMYVYVYKFGIYLYPHPLLERQKLKRCCHFLFTFSSRLEICHAYVLYCQANNTQKNDLAMKECSKASGEST